MHSRSTVHSSACTWKAATLPHGCAPPPSPLPHPALRLHLALQLPQPPLQAQLGHVQALGRPAAHLLLLHRTASRAAVAGHFSWAGLLGCWAGLLGRDASMHAQAAVAVRRSAPAAPLLPSPPPLLAPIISKAP